MWEPDSAPGRLEPARTSSLAITSLICGLLSPLFLLACNLSLFTSLVAIVTGHLARREIKSSRGQVGGNGQAITGLISGYLLLAVSAAVLVFFVASFRQGWERAKESRMSGSESPLDGPAGASANASSDRLRDAELGTLTAGQEGPASGNTPVARLLAAEYSRSLKTMRDAFFTADRDRVFRLTDGQFIVHCELHEDRCAFIVHVPAYRDFSADAKETLAIHAWQIAQQTVENTLRPGDELAVGLRGTALYGAVMTGRVTADEDQRDAFERGERDALLAFFPATSRDVEAPIADEAPVLESDLRPNNRQPAPPIAPAEPKPAPTVAGRDPYPAGDLASVPAEVPLLENELDIQVVHRFPEIGWGIQSLAFSADSRWLAAGKMDRTVMIFDMETGSRIAVATDLRELGQIECIAFAPDGKHLFAGGSSGVTQFWPVDPGGQLGTAAALYRHARAARVLAPSTASPFVLSGGADGTLTWQTYGRETTNVRTLKGFDRSVLAVRLPTDGFEALATDGRTLLRFDLRSATELQSPPLARSGTQAAAFSDDGAQLAISTGSDLRVWDTGSCREIQTLAREAAEIQWSVRFHPNGRWLISGGRGKAHVWDLETTRSLATIDLGGVLYIQVLAISPDGRLLAAIPSAAGQSLTVVRLPDAADAPPAN
jgi:hypothetical protein